MPLLEASIAKYDVVQAILSRPKSPCHRLVIVSDPAPIASEYQNLGFAVRHSEIDWTGCFYHKPLDLLWSLSLSEQCCEYPFCLLLFQSNGFICCDTGIEQ